MNRKTLFLAGVGIAVLIGLIFFAFTNRAGATETCPNTGDGWVKVDDLDGHTYTYAPKDGYEVTDNCYKHATSVHFGTGDTVTTDVHEVCTKKKCRDFRPELSHASFKLEKLPETMVVCLDGENEKEIPKTREAWKRVLFSFPEAYIGECKDPEPEPEPEPEQPRVVPPSPHTDGLSDGKNQQPAHRVCTIEHTAPINWYENGEFKWATDESVEKFSIIFGPSPDELIYGIDNIPGDSRGIEINRPNWGQTWFQVQSWIDGCMFPSETIDP